MAILQAYSWWYVRGWAVFARKLRVGLSNAVDFFSMGSLIRTLFKPFRQISADKAGVDSSLDIKFHMFLDRLISRIVGFFSRLILLLVGSIVIAIGGVMGLVLMVIWPVIPLLPIVGIILSVGGVML